MKGGKERLVLRSSLLAVHNEHEEHLVTCFCEAYSLCFYLTLHHTTQKLEEAHAS